LVIALLQGLTEFLPVSSSGHLILLPNLTGWQDQGTAADIAAHVGTLTAVVLYFRKDLMVMSKDWVNSICGKGITSNSRLAWAVILGTIPACIIGLMVHNHVETILRNPLVIATTTIGFGLLLGIADKTARLQRDEMSLTKRDAIIIGCAQVLALIPGTSRSGITMTAGLMLGLTSEAAARFSFLLSIPLIAIAGGWESLRLVRGVGSVDWISLALIVGLSAIAAFLCIHFFLKLINRIGMMPFVIYRLALGGLLLWLYL